jgi:hypothetical protein
LITLTNSTLLRARIVNLPFCTFLRSPFMVPTILSPDSQTFSVYALSSARGTDSHAHAKEKSKINRFGMFMLLYNRV